jgi:hypothetical protein
MVSFAQIRRAAHRTEKARIDVIDACAKFQCPEECACKVHEQKRRKKAELEAEIAALELEQQLALEEQAARKALAAKEAKSVARLLRKMAAVTQFDPLDKVLWDHLSLDDMLSYVCNLRC